MKNARDWKRANDANRRLSGAFLASLGINFLLWSGVGAAIWSQKSAPSAPIEISRVILTPNGQKQPKIVSQTQIAPKVARLRHQVVRRPKIGEIRRPRVEKARLAPSQAAPRNQNFARPNLNALKTPLPPAPRSFGARSRVLTSQNSATTSTHFAKNSGENASKKPRAAKNEGDQKTNSQNPVSNLSQPQPTAQSEAPATPILPTSEPQPTSTPRPEPTNTPKPEPTSTPRPEPTYTPKPEPTKTPRPQGPTREAMTTREIRPSIPDELRNGEFKTSAPVRVKIGADGSASPSLRSSSGNAEIDRRVLAALRRWRWKPALKNGEPVSSIQTFRYDFQVP